MGKRVLWTAAALLVMGCAGQDEVIVDTPDAPGTDDGGGATDDGSYVDNGYGASGDDTGSGPGDDASSPPPPDDAGGGDASVPPFDSSPPPPPQDSAPPPFDVGPPPFDAGGNACDPTNQKYVDEYIQAIQSNMVVPCSTPCTGAECCFSGLACVAL